MGFLSLSYLLMRKRNKYMSIYEEILEGREGKQLGSVGKENVYFQRFKLIDEMGESMQDLYGIFCEDKKLILSCSEYQYLNTFRSPLLHPVTISFYFLCLAIENPCAFSFGWLYKDRQLYSLISLTWSLADNAKISSLFVLYI